MGTTSPDGIYYPDSSSTTALSVELAAMATSIQAALATSNWQTITPAVTASTPGAGLVVSATMEYAKVGSLIFFSVDATVTAGGTATGGLLITMPVTLKSGSIPYMVSGRERASTGNQLTGSITGSTMSVYTYANATMIATGRIANLSGFYRWA